MEPIFEFIGTTNSTLISKKKGGRDILKNRIYVVKKTLSDGSVFYLEYTISKVNSTSIGLRCVNQRKCNSTLTLETSHEIIVERTHIERSGKKRNVYNFSQEANLADDSLYGQVFHRHSSTYSINSPSEPKLGWPESAEFSRAGKSKKIHVYYMYKFITVTYISDRTRTESLIRILFN